MTQRALLAAEVRALLRCVRCHGVLTAGASTYNCQDPACGSSYPVVDGIPVLVASERSVFSVEEILATRSAAGKRKGLRAFVLQSLPSLSSSHPTSRNCALFARLLSERSAPRVLVVGGRTDRSDHAPLLARRDIEFVETDIRFGPKTAVICDAHDLPFASGSFDGVLITWVLEHVLDPARSVDEVHRVLRDDGIVYAETPFMQQVHEGAYDFTRFTHLGHRRLFRTFDDIDSGIVGGPGMALAWAWRYFLTSIAQRGLPRALAIAFSALTAFWLPLLDPLLARRPGSFDAASGFYFLGRRSLDVLSDRDLVRRYRGAG